MVEELRVDQKLVRVRGIDEITVLVTGGYSRIIVQMHGKLHESSLLLRNQPVVDRFVVGETVGIAGIGVIFVQSEDLDHVPVVGISNLFLLRCEMFGLDRDLGLRSRPALRQDRTEIDPLHARLLGRVDELVFDRLALVVVNILAEVGPPRRTTGSEIPAAARTSRSSTPISTRNGNNSAGQVSGTVNISVTCSP